MAGSRWKYIAHSFSKPIRAQLWEVGNEGLLRLPKNYKKSYPKAIAQVWGLGPSSRSLLFSDEPAAAAELHISARLGTLDIEILSV